MESLTLTGGSVEYMFGSVQVTDVDWNVVLWMWSRITQVRSLLHLSRVRSVKTTALRRMTDFDEVTFQEQFRFTKTEFLVILSNMMDKNGGHLVDEWCVLCDLKFLLDLSRSGLSRVFRFILTMVKQRYDKLVSKV